MKIKLNKKNKLIILYTLAVTCLVTVTVFSVTLGSVSLSFKEIVSGLLGTSETEKIIIRDLRLPRVWGSVLAGASLSSAGLILQCVTNNPLCAPNIVGINSGAGFAVMLMLLALMAGMVIPASAEPPYESYFYDVDGVWVGSANAYSVSEYITPASLGVSITAFADMVSHDGKIFILDKGSSDASAKIIILNDKFDVIS